MASGTTYQRGDWIVPKHYGVGQIKGVEQRSISGETTQYCRICADNSTFWVPLDMLDQFLRPLVHLKSGFAHIYFGVLCI